VNLVDPKAKGIHMSRLFVALQETLPVHPLTPAVLSELLGRFVTSQAGRATAAYINLEFELVVRRPALLSDNFGFRTYPARIEASLVNGQRRFVVTATSTYSSTCPCSASLSRQLTQELFREAFEGRDNVSADEVLAWLGKADSVGGTPHSQRSKAITTVVLDPQATHFRLLDLVEAAENAVQTPVQTAVKREDEQEFARLNARNLMFCEDASRRLKHAFDQLDGVLDYRIEARHIESLHPHDAVAIVTKGVDGGLRA